MSLGINKKNKWLDISMLSFYFKVTKSLYIYGIHHWRFLEVALKTWPEWVWTWDHWIPFRHSNRLSCQAKSLTRSQRLLCTTTPISSLCSVITFQFGLFAFVSRHICFKQSFAQVITLAVEWIDTYGIHHWRSFITSYLNLTWVGFESRTTEFRSDALTDLAIRPWVQLALRANLVQSNFISFFSLHVAKALNVSFII